MSRHWGPATAPTKDEHDAIVAMRGRHYTDDGHRGVKVREPASSDRTSPIDEYLNLKGRTC